MERWSAEKCLQLIAVYKSKPVLWNPKDPSYFQKKFKSQAWTEMGRELNEDPEVCKAKIVSLLSSLRRERSKIRNSRRNGKGQWYKSGWFAFEALTFLSGRDKRMIADEEKPVKIEIDDNDVDEEHEVFDDPTISAPTTSNLITTQEIEMPKPFETVNTDNKPENNNSCYNSCNNIMTNNSNYNDDEEIRAFTNFVAAKMNKYPKKTKNSVQRAIMEIIFQADEGSYENPPDQMYSYVEDK